MINQLDPSPLLHLPTWIATLWLSNQNKVNRHSTPQNAMVKVFLHLIKPLRLFSDGALRKNLSTLSSGSKGNFCVSDRVQLKTLGKKRTINDQWTSLSLKLRVRLSSPLTTQPPSLLSSLSFLDSSLKSRSGSWDSTNTALLAPQPGKHP